MQPQTQPQADVPRATRLSTEELYRAHRTFVARFLTRLGVRPEALDDAVQEVFITVHRRGGYELGAAKPTTYLATIAVNTAAAQRRLARTQQARQSDHALDDLAAGGGDPVQALETREELYRLGRALDRLDPTLRDTLLLADGEGESCVAIADATSVPLGTVYWRLDRARKKFREALNKMELALPPIPQRNPRQRRLGMLLAFFGARNEESATQAPLALGGKAMLGMGAGAAAALAAGLLFFAQPLAQPPAASAHLVAPSTRARSDRPAPENSATTASPVTVEVAQLPNEVAALPSVVAALSRQVAQPPGRERRKSAALPSRADKKPAITTSTSSTQAGVDTSHATRANTAEQAAVAPAEAEVPARESPTRTAALPAPQPAPELSEAAQLARAEGLLATNPREALAALRALDARASANYLREERDYIELMARLGSGERETGRALASAFLRRYPASAFARVVRTSAGLPER